MQTYPSRLSAYSPLCAALLLALVGCSPKAGEAGANVAPESAPAPTPAADAASVSLDAPAGQYQLDPAHANLQFSLLHMGLSNYVAGFTDYSLEMQLDTNTPSASSVSVVIDPKSIRTDYRGDYKATHADSAFNSWEEDLAMSEKFFNAANYPEIRYQSKAVAAQADGSYRVDGELTLLGQTHPVALTVAVVGATAKHPFSKRGALGLKATGVFKRSTFGMNFLLSPPLVGDEVTVTFDGELHAAP